jgi:phosphate/sulfate permease
LCFFLFGFCHGEILVYIQYVIPVQFSSLSVHHIRSSANISLSCLLSPVLSYITAVILSSLLYTTIHYATLLYSNLLYPTLLYPTLHYPTLSCPTPHYPILPYPPTELYFPIHSFPSYSIPSQWSQYCTVLSRTLLYNTALRLLTLYSLHIKKKNLE